MSTPLVVVKIGGSLFTQPNFVSRLKDWCLRLRSQTYPAHIVLVTGGGPLVDGLRAVDRANQMAVEFSHWLAVHLMDVNARLLSHWWPELPVRSSLAETQQQLEPSAMTLLLVEHFLRYEEPGMAGQRLPWGWDVTGDSIAARLAIVLKAKQLILVKSRPAPPVMDWFRASQEGLVDGYFPTLATSLPQVRVVCLSHVYAKS